MFGDEQSLDGGEIVTLHPGIRSGDIIAHSSVLLGDSHFRSSLWI
jgi:hypothetical protein